MVLQNGSIWSVQTIVNPGDAARSSVRWFQIRESDSVVLQSGTISDPTLSLFFPSIAVNNAGDVVIGFSGSSSATFASAYAVVGKTTAGTTTFNPIALLKAGVDDYQQLDGSARNRWGDYSVTVVDPVNDNVFWTIQEYAAADRNFDGTGTLADNNWAVQITQITIPEPATMLLTVSGFAVLGCRRLPRDRRK